jgi:nitrate/TMAO reductase-like tetraheme cytochrome c subunit
MKIQILFLFLLTAAVAAGAAGAGRPSPKGACLVCHKLKTPNLYADWHSSAHAKNGVTCLDCHEARASEPDSYAHGGATISLFVTPKDCAGCHEVETSQYARSGHAGAAVDLESIDPGLRANYGEPGSCSKCHGGHARRDPDRPIGQPVVPRPEHGVGRLNQDGSLGACTPCHAEHRFARDVARKDSTCTACHGEEHRPRHEGAILAAGGRRAGVPPLDSQVACASCHMSVGRGRPVSHLIQRKGL